MNSDTISRRIFDPGARGDDRAAQNMLNVNLGVSREEREAQRQEWADDVIRKAEEASRKLWAEAGGHPEEARNV